jgi:phosphate transport system substrate-binding protein
MKKTITLALASALLLIGAMGTASAAQEGLRPYKKVSGVSGSIGSVGSDTMNNMMALWCEGFARQYPSVRCQIEGKGSSTAPPALIEGTAQIGPMSRPMKSSEKDKFEARFGYKPLEIKTSIDSLAVYVGKDNPIAGLTMEQVDAVFSKTRKCGTDRDAATWGDLGLTGSWKDRPISIYGRNSASGTYGFFKEHALCKGDYKDTVKEQPGSASVVQGVTKDMGGVGYSGIGYRTSGVRALPLAAKGKKEFFEPSLDNVLSGKYPLGRFLYVYVNKDPRKGLDPLLREFVTFALSREGQEIVVKDGYDPLPPAIADEMLKALK